VFTVLRVRNRTWSLAPPPRKKSNYGHICLQSERSLCNHHLFRMTHTVCNLILCVFRVILYTTLSTISPPVIIHQCTWAEGLSWAWGTASELLKYYKIWSNSNVDVLEDLNINIFYTVSIQGSSQQKMENEVQTLSVDLSETTTVCVCIYTHTHKNNMCSEALLVIHISGKYSWKSCGKKRTRKWGFLWFPPKWQETAS